MKSCHIIGAGGVAGIGLTRCLKDHYEVKGHDLSPWGELAAECPVEPHCDPWCYSDMVFPVPDKAVAKYAESSLCFLPPKEIIEVCQDKARTAEALGDLAPKTFWVRDTEGAGGKGAQMASEYLPGKNYSVEMVWWRGKLKGYFMKQRLGYDLQGSMEPTHQRGSSAVSRCIDNKDLLKKSVIAVWRLYEERSDEPHGIFSLDFKCNEDGIPKITEINPGRFLTASYVYFYALDYNLPLMAAQLFLGDGVHPLGKYPLGKVVIRQTDCEPVIVDESEISYPSDWKGWK